MSGATRGEGGALGIAGRGQAPLLRCTSRPRAGHVLLARTRAARPEFPPRTPNSRPAPKPTPRTRRSGFSRDPPARRRGGRASMSGATRGEGGALGIAGRGQAPLLRRTSRPRTGHVLLARTRAARPELPPRARPMPRTRRSGFSRDPRPSAVAGRASMSGATRGEGGAPRHRRSRPSAAPTGCPGHVGVPAASPPSPGPGPAAVRSFTARQPRNRSSTTASQNN